MQLRPKAVSAPAAALLVVAVSGYAVAHELEVDQLRLWVDPRGDLHAQLFLDPELTRPSESAISDDEARSRVRALVVANVRIETDGSPCTFSTETRELYVLGGAAPGDVVKLQCSPKTPISDLKLVLGSALPRLAVEAVGFVPSDGASDALINVRLVDAGTTLSLQRRVALDAPSTGATTTPSNSSANNHWLSSIARFVRLGIEHIVPSGLDHVLFVVGLSLRQTKLRSLMWQLLAFTLAHTSTLALVTLGYFQVSARWVEPLIALSIVVVALANLRPLESEQAKPRLGLCFGFGLIHGLGFAGALGALGMPQQALLPALLGFNLGVELGQVLVALSALGLLSLAGKVNRQRELQRWSSALIAAIGLFLLFDRL